MDWLALSIFTEVAAGGSLAKVARRLRIAPMSATRHLTALEKDLGVRLVHRTTRSIALTSEGQVFLPHARALLKGRQAAYDIVKQDAAGASGLLRMTTSVAFGRKVAAPMIAGFMHDNPGVKVELLMTDSLVDMVAEGLDLAVRIANLADSSLVARRLAANPRVLLASPDYLKHHGTPKRLDDLSAHHCLAITGTTHWGFSTEAAVRRTRISGRFSANSIEGLLQACIGGLGIANLSAWFVQDELRSGALRKVMLADAGPEALGIWAVYPTSQMVPPKVRLFVDRLGEHLRDRDVAVQ